VKMLALVSDLCSIGLKPYWCFRWWPHTENIGGSNLAAVMCTTVQVSKTAVVPSK
jgi:hypothetical protein